MVQPSQRRAPDTSRQSVAGPSDQPVPVRPGALIAGNRTSGNRTSGSRTSGSRTSGNPVTGNRASGFRTSGFNLARQARDVPASWLVVAGTVAAVLSVFTEARLGPREADAHDPSSWWGILPSETFAGSWRGALAGVAVLTLIIFCLCWWVFVRSVATGRASRRTVWTAWIAWTAPFALGPPLFSRDVYAYAAQGELARRGMDPATHGIASLRAFGSAGAAFVSPVDPRWRHSHAPYGGTAVAIQKTAASIGEALFAGPTGVVVVFKVIAILAVIALVVATWQLLRLVPSLAPGLPVGPPAPGEPDPRWPYVLAFVGCNPVVVIHLAGGAHLDGVAAALVVAAVVVDLRGRDRDAAGGKAAAVAVGLATLAATVKVTAGLALAWLIVVHIRRALARTDATNTATATDDTTATTTAAAATATNTAAATNTATNTASGDPANAAEAARASADTSDGDGDGASDDTDADTDGQRYGAAAGALGADLVVVALTTAVSMLAAGFGPTWISALSTSSEVVTGVAPVAIVAASIRALLNIVGIGDTGLVVVCRAVALAGAAGVVGWLLWRVWRDWTPETEARAGLKVVGYGGLAVALGSPVLYPWYLALAVPAAAVLLAGRPSVGVRLVVYRVAVFSSVWLCIATMSSLTPTWKLLGSDRMALVIAVLAVASTVALTAHAAAATRRQPLADAALPPPPLLPPGHRDPSS